MKWGNEFQIDYHTVPGLRIHLLHTAWMIKFVLNLGVGASVLPVCSFLLSSGYQLSDLFNFMSFSAVIILVASLLLPSQSKKLI